MGALSESEWELLLQKALTMGEEEVLYVAENTIRKGMTAFLEVGEALVTIRDRRLYRATHPTFEEYCKDRWGMGRSRAYQLINASEVVRVLEASVSTNVDKGQLPLPQNEAQARALQAAPPEVRAEVWREAVERSGGAAPPARAVTEVARELTAPAAHTPLAQHRSESNEWYTPADVIVRVRQVFDGRIDLDPASSHDANRVVRADAIWTEDEDGLSCEWWGNVYLNPPYGWTDGRVSSLDRWTAEAIDRYSRGEIAQIIMLVKASTGDSWFRRLWGGVVCFPYRRLQFRRPGDEDASEGAPHSSALVYFGPDEAAFARAFEGLGEVVGPDRRSCAGEK